MNKTLPAPIQRHFSAEKTEGIFLMVFGLCQVAVSILAWFWKQEIFYIGLMVSIVPVALFQMVMAFKMNRMMPLILDRIGNSLTANPSGMAKFGIQRITMVIQKLALYRRLETTAFFIGLGLLWFGEPDGFLSGLGIGLAFTSAFMRTVDFFASLRAVRYRNFLTQFLKDPTQSG